MSNRRHRLRKRRLHELPLSRLFPNMVTMAGLCCGLSSIRFAMDGRFEIAVTLLVAAAILDGMDGRIARFLNATSTFGAQLDSLSDFLCFGVAPVLVAFCWRLHDIKGLGWAVVLFYSVCCALRLARFNTNLIEDEDAGHNSWKKKFFVGIPSPAGAMLCLLPIVLSFVEGGYRIHPIIIAAWVALVGALMASRVPTFAVKKIRIHHELVLPIMFVFCICMVIVLVEPWFMFVILMLGYMASLPFSISHYRKLAKQSTLHVHVSPVVPSLPE